MKLGNYELLNELGRGGAGVVFRARAPSGELVAVKVLLQSSPERLARFRREERLLQSLGEAEGFVPLLELGESPRGPYFVMPLLEGGTLRERLRRGAGGVDDSVALARAISRSVARAHAAGIVHRDLKPENVLFSRDGRTFVADLGLAKHFDPAALGASQSRALTRSSEMLGTLGYMAPEQTLKPAGVGPPADVFAIGAILYELLAGESPFDAETAVELLNKSGSGEFVPLRTRRPEVPVWLAAVVEGCLHPDPAKRPRDAGELLRALEPPPANVRGRGRLVVLGVLAALVLLGTGVAVGLALARAREPAATLPSPGPRPSVRPTPSPSPTPTPSPTPRPALRFPAACASFLETRRTKLASVLGTYEGKNLAMVQPLVLTPDGKSVVSSSLDGWVVIWDLETGEERFARHVPDQLFSLAISPDGETLFAGGGQGGLHILAVHGTGARSFEAHKGAIFSIALDPDGQSVWTAGSDGILVRQDLATGARLGEHAWGTFGAPIPGVRGFLLARGDNVVLASLETGEARALTSPVEGPVMSIAIAPDGKRALTGTQGGRLVLWNLETVEAMKVLDGHQALISDLAFSSDGTRAISSSFDATARIWDLATGETLQVLRGHAGWVTKGRFTLDGKSVVTGGNDQTLRLWDVATGRERWAHPGHAGRVTALAAYDEGAGLLTGGVDSVLRGWDLAPGTESSVGTTETWIAGVAALAGAARAITVGGASARGRKSIGELALWDVGSRKRLAGSRGETGWIRAVALRADGNAVTVGEGQEGKGELVAWRLDPSALAPVGRVPLPARGNSVVASASGRVAAALEDGSVPLWSGEALTSEGVIEGDGAPASSVAFAPDGKTLAIGYANGAVVTFDLSSRTQGVARARHATGLTCLAFLEGGRLLAVAEGGGAIALEDAATGEEVDRVSLESSRDRVLSIAPLGNGGFAVGTNRGVVLRFELTPAKK